MLILILRLVFSNSKPKFIFWQIGVEKVELFTLSVRWYTEYL